MALAMAHAHGWPCVKLLRRTRYTAPQSTLSKTQRAQNVRGSLTHEPVDLTGWEVWLVDDVKTSGATLTACCQMLRKTGAAKIHIAVAAVADPGGQRFKVVTPFK